ncbi:MAG: hypothetical protein ABI281_12100 [Caldimonas sp.]
MAHDLTRRCLVLAPLAAAAAATATGCTSLIAPDHIDVPQARLQESLGKRFPIVRRLAEGLDFTMVAPLLTMRPEADRIAVECTVTGGEALFARPLRGTLLASCGLVFDAAERSVRPSEVRVELVRFEGLPRGLERAVERLGRPLAEGWLAQQPVYVLRPVDVERLQAAGRVPGAIRVTSAGVRIELKPA